MMYSKFYELDAAVKVNIAKGDYSGALENLKQFIISVMNMESTPGEVVGARKVDELCELIGDSYFSRFFQASVEDKPFESSDKRVVILCTGLYKYGGTSLVISDLVKAHPGYECTVIATNYLDDMTPEDLELSRIGSSGATVSVCPKGDARKKLHWLIQQLLDIAPSRIFLLNHHQDSVMISAARPFVDRTKVIFYHHADYNMCLGVHLKGAIHVDPHNVGFYNCRTKEGISDNTYLPLTVDDLGVNRVGADFMRTNELTTCSSGHYLKFRNFYLYPYADLIVDRLKFQNGTHIHIGALLEPDIARMRKKLIDHGIDAARFVHIPWTASLWETLVKNEVDLFIGSFPIGGARTTIEVMGAGIPILMPQNYLSRFFSSRDIVYPDAFLWKYPVDFSNVLADITAESLAAHSARARAHYVSNYSSECADLEGKIHAICAGLPTPAPYELYPHQPDYLDRALHFGELDVLTSGYAVDKAIASLANSPAQNAPEHENASPRSRFDGIFSTSITKIVAKLRTLKKRASKALTGQLKPPRPSTLGDAVRSLSSADQELYLAIVEKPESIGFEPANYLRRNPDVAAAGMDPLIHFVRHGQNEGRASTFFFSPDWHAEMNGGDGVGLSNILINLAQTRSDSTRMKAAFFAYGWNLEGLPDAYMREMIASLADLGVNVDVYIGGHYSQNTGTKGFRPDLKKSDMNAFIQEQSYDFALSFNNALVFTETVDALNCKIVSVIVDSIHHLFDHEDEGLWEAFKLPIHAAPIYTSIISELEGRTGHYAPASFLPAATTIERRQVASNEEMIHISWIASMLGDYHLDGFLSRIDNEVPGGFELITRCLKDIERTGEISTSRASQEAARILCDWSRWDYALLEMHLQEIITNRARLAVVENLAPLGLKVFGNARWRTALTMSPGVLCAFQSGATLRSHADLCAIYDRSKISINIPQVHAGTGMQYRILDILASKSLLITQYVPGSDMERLFGPDSPIVTFTDIDDLHAKCAYYLKNEDERLARVKACNALVAEGFSFRERVLEYLALSNPSLAKKVGDATGRGSVALILPERIIETARKTREGRAPNHGLLRRT